MCLSPDSGDSVRRRGGADPRRAPRRREGGRGRAGGVRPAPPHLPPPGRRAGAERCAAALRHPGRHQAAGSAALLARGEGRSDGAPALYWREEDRERDGEKNSVPTM